ncbi:MAG TPA: sigma-70 family RNA polymerase sigma factor [Opitutaceae bacterium]
MSSASSNGELIEHFFRHETGRLHGVLLRLLGIENMALVEDLAQEAMLRAFRSWSMGGIPANPSAWITQVAKNLARDALRHRTMSSGKEASLQVHWEMTTGANGPPANDGVGVNDDTLRLLFVCCHPSVSSDAQVVLALKVICGFSTSEIARAFLSTEAAIEKQLTRTRQRIQTERLPFEIPEGDNLEARVDGVLAALYLLFNEGYKASAGERLLREDLCREAIRLTSLVIQHPAGNRPSARALLALMLLTMARFPSRTDEQGALLRLDDQDRAKWDQSLIDQGLLQMAQAAQGDRITEYHLQAGIAALHCLAPNYASTDWAGIVRFYNGLSRLHASPIVELNRAVAIAQVDGPQAALECIANAPQQDKLERYYLTHATIGELHWRLGEHRQAAESFRRALQQAQLEPEQLYLQRMLDRAVAAV